MVTREEFDAQALQLTRIRERLDMLEKRVEELEALLKASQQRPSTVQ
jgi:BMFP domain-containing protein YqiC